MIVISFDTEHVYHIFEFNSLQMHRIQRVFRGAAPFRSHHRCFGSAPIVLGDSNVKVLSEPSNRRNYDTILFKSAEEAVAHVLKPNSNIYIHTGKLIAAHHLVRIRIAATESIHVLQLLQHHPSFLLHFQRLPRIVTYGGLRYV